MIKTIKWNNQPVLGDLVLDFTKEDGSPYNTIVIAGENGAGKTSVLETLSDFLNLGSVQPFNYIQYQIDNVNYKVIPDENNAHIGFHTRINELDNSETHIASNKHSKGNIDTDLLDIRHYGCSYSKARSGFRTKPVKSSTTEQLDVSRYEDDSNDDFTKIKQMLVDIKSQDNSEWAKISSRGENMIYSQFRTISKTYRFENAFNNFFDVLRFDGIDEESADEKKIIFTKHNKEIAIDDLSTGEMQIVFRGAHLLKNSNSLDGGTIIIDEPELSMHPKWQEKIFDYYRGLFTKNANQTAQMIFATHSEYVIRSAIKDPDNVLVIILYDDNGTIKSKRADECVLPSLTASEINYLAFGIKSIDYHIALYGDLQTQTGKSNIRDMDNYIATQAEYDATLHQKIDTTYGSYQTLPTYIRNAIDHPDSGRSYTDEELSISITLLRDLCKRHRFAP